MENKILIWLMVLFISLVLAPPRTMAASGVWTNEQVYEATKEACLSVNEVDALGSTLESDRLRSGYFRSPKFNKLITALKSSSFQSAFTEFTYNEKSDSYFFILKNPGFVQALRECYPSNQKMVLFFQGALYKADISGKFFAGASLAAIFTMTSVAISRLGTAGRYLARAADLMALTAIAASIYLSFVEKTETTKQITELCIGTPPTSVSENECLTSRIQEGNALISKSSENQRLINQALNSVLKEMVLNQIKELESALLLANSTKEKLYYQSLINERQKFLRDHQNNGS